MNCGGRFRADLRFDAFATMLRARYRPGLLYRKARSDELVPTRQKRQTADPIEQPASLDDVLPFAYQFGQQMSSFWSNKIALIRLDF
jgi:hypothetical protein